MKAASVKRLNTSYITHRILNISIAYVHLYDSVFWRSLNYTVSQKRVPP